MKTILALLLFVFLNASVSANNDLVFAQIEKMPSEPNFYRPLDHIFEEIFYDSEFVLRPKSIPVGSRVFAGMVRGDIDIALLGLNDRVLEGFPYEFIEIYPVSLIKLPRHYYSVKSTGVATYGNNLKKHIESGEYRLGMMRMPAHIVEKVLQQSVGSVTFFSSHLKLTKGLASGRVDVIISGEHVAHATFDLLGIDKDIMDLGYAYSVDLFVLLRNTLPEAKRTAIEALLAKRIPEMKRQGRIRKILAKSDWQATD